MIVVTGATGNLGKLIVERLLARLPASRIGVSVRDPDNAKGLAQRGVRVCHGDFDIPESLSSAFHGASQILVVSSNARAYGKDPVAQFRAAIEAARAAGARRIIYTSHMGVSASSAFAPMHDHATAEAMLSDSGMTWTALRNGFYASTVSMLIGDSVSSGVLAAPQDGKVSWTAHVDLAAAAAEVLLQEGRFEGPTPPLTASRAWDLGEVGAMLAGTHGRTVRRELVSDEDYAAGMSGRGIPQSGIDIMLGLYRAARTGEFAAVDPTLASLIGRAPTSLRDVLTASQKE